MATPHEDWMLPAGVADVLPPEAEALERLRGTLLALYRSWGYQLVITPMVEYLETLLTGVGQDLDLQTFKLTDQLNGRLMGVRADMTPQVARIDAHHLHGEAVRRLCYVGTVLHTRPDAFGGSRCPLQMGAELYGHGGCESDLEVLELMLESLRVAGVVDVHLALGHSGILRATLDAAGIPPPVRPLLLDILQRKASPDLASFLSAHAVSAEGGGLLRALLELHGEPDVLPLAAEQLAEMPAAAGPLQELRWLVAQLRERWPAVALHVDLAETRGYGYHGGLVFAAFQHGQGREIARGGRYRMGGLQQARPATGFTADIKTLLLASEPRVPAPAPHTVLAPATQDAALRDYVERLRREGHCVVTALPGAASPPAAAIIEPDGQGGWHMRHCEDEKE
ncbi:MAG: ATP phosphoribosyltransferase regulatory subunit [Pseudomonadota bacterium]|nr:ATP phosphoribosyltransferase regulatory subunit [Pseudomonadota bacterium]